MTNIQLNAATTVGALLASDTVAGVDYQKMKVTFSTDGSVPVSVDATHPMPVTFGGAGLSANITQFGGSNVVTGLGGSGAGIPRVTVSNDTELQIWDGANGPVAVKPASTAAVAADKALVVAISPNNSVAVTGTVTTTPPANASTNIAQVGGAAISEGQKTMAASVPVVIASDQSAVPVSGTVTTTPPANASTNIAQVGGTNVTLGAKTSAASIPVVLATDEAALPVTGTFFQATQPVSIAGTVAENLTQVASTVLGVPQTFGTAPTGVVLGTSADVYVAGTRAVTGTGASGAGVQRVTVSNDSVIASITAAVAVTPPTLTKGTQGATGFSTQDLKDAGRNQTNYFTISQVASTATETLQSLTGYKGGVAVGATTTPAVVTAGKTYRIQSITITYVGIVTTVGAIQINLRANLSGVVAVGSPLVCSWLVGEQLTGTAVAGDATTVTIPFPDGIEFAAGTGIGITALGINPAGGAAVVGFSKVSVQGYEY